MKKKFISCILCMTIILLTSFPVHAERQSIYETAKNFEMTVCKTFMKDIFWDITVSDMSDEDMFDEDHQLGTYADGYDDAGFERNDFDISYYYDSTRDTLLQLFIYKDGRIAYVVWNKFGSADLAFLGGNYE